MTSQPILGLWWKGVGGKRYTARQNSNHLAKRLGAMVGHGMTQHAAAEVEGITPNEACRWLKNGCPPFREATPTPTRTRRPKLWPPITTRISSAYLAEVMEREMWRGRHWRHSPGAAWTYPDDTFLWFDTTERDP